MNKKTYYQFIQEIFEKSAPWKKESNGNVFSEETYSFKIDDKKYSVIFFKEESQTIQIEFQLAQIGNKRVNPDKIDKITGTGDQFLVFATVIDIWKNFIKNYPEYKTYEFLALKKEESRVSLYKKMIKKLIPSGWKFFIYSDEIYMNFTLEKK